MRVFSSRPFSSIKVLDIVCALSILANALLVTSIVRLDRRLPSTANKPKLERGMLMPPLEAVDLNGRTVSIAMNQGRPTLLYVFGVDCVWSTRNVTNIRALTTAVRDQYAIVGIALDDLPLDRLKAYVDEQRLGFDVYSHVPSALAASYALRSSPQTLIIGPDGRLEERWVGAYQFGVQRTVETRFAIALPGLSKLEGVLEDTE
jgi:peroxiredoxin